MLLLGFGARNGFWGGCGAGIAGAAAALAGIAQSAPRASARRSLRCEPTIRVRRADPTAGARSARVVRCVVVVAGQRGLQLPEPSADRPADLGDAPRTE